MTAKAQRDRLAFEAEIRANAVSYRVHLFLGRGQYDRADAATSNEALALGAAMKAAHPTCQAQPMYYAIEPSGHSIPITPAQIQQEKTMETASMTDTNDIDAKRAKKAEAQRASRAKQKAASDASKAEVAKIKAERKAAKAKAKAPKVAAKPAKPAKKAAGRKAKPEARASGGKRAAILAAAERGVLPAAPDFSAPTHARFRDKLHEVVVMAMAGNLAGLKKFTINPVSSSPKAIDRYRNLAVIALKARAANGGVQAA